MNINFVIIHLYFYKVKVMEWDFDKSRNKRTEDYLFKLTRNMNLSQNASKLIDLYNFLHSKKFKNPQELKNSVIIGLRPLFSSKQAETLFTLLKTPQKGGADTKLITSLTNRIVASVDESLPNIVRGPVDFVVPYFFILHKLEQTPGLGTFLTIWLDSIGKGSTTAANFLQSLTPTIVGITGIPEGGPIGSLIGWALACPMIFMDLAIHTSRRNFDEVFIDVWLLIPFVGSAIHNAVMKGDDFLTETFEKRTKFLEDVGKLPGIGSELEAILDSFLFDPLYDPNDPEQIKKAEEKRQKSAERLQALRTRATDSFSTLQSQGTQALATLKNSQQFQKVQQQVQKARAGIPPFKSETRVEELDSGPTAPAGGKRFSLRKHKHKKWKTQRRKLKKF